MKKILYLAFRFPIPANDGYKMRVYYYCKMMKELGYEVDLFFIDSKAGVLEYHNNKKAAKELFNNIYYREHTKKQKLKNAVKSILKNESLQQNHYFDIEGKKQVEELQKINKYDKVVSSYIRMFDYIKDLEGAEKIIDYTDSISYNYFDAKEKAKGLWKYIYKYEYPRVKKYEKYILENIHKAYITSPEDRDFILEGEKPKVQFSVFPQGISDEALNYSRVNYEEDIISFIGQMSYYPNVDAVEYFCNEILEKLDFKGIFYIVGKNPSKKVLELEKKYKNVKVTGFVDDPYEILAKSKLIVAPMRLGGGIQNKVLEGMALGKVVVTFEKIVKPIIGSIHGENIISCRDTEDYIDKVNMVLNETIEYRKNIGKNSKN